MLKRLMNFLMFSTGITPKDHREPDKWAEFRAKREEWEKSQRAEEDSDRPEPATPSERSANTNG